MDINQKIIKEYQTLIQAKGPSTNILDDITTLDNDEEEAKHFDHPDDSIKPKPS